MNTHPSLPPACSVAAKACILFAAVSTLCASSVQAGCPQGWDVSNGWRVKQGQTNVHLDLRQNGTVITGTARYEGITSKAGSGPLGKFAGVGTIRGTVDGTIVGDQFEMHIYWENNHTIGVYNGTIRPSGKIEGTIYDKANPARKQDWYSDTRMPCAETNQGTKKSVGPATAPAPAPPAPPKVVHHTGSDGSGSKASGAVGTSFVKDARIMAAPTVVKIPAGQSEGTTQIYWNAGEAHPYAEVWVKVGDEDEKRLIEKGKGSNAMKVRPGRNVFILTDAGEQLATVTVTGK